MRARDVISITLFIILIIYGPIFDWSGALIFRIAYIIVLPYGLWILLGWLSRKFYISEVVDNIAKRTTYILIGIFLIYLGIHFFNAKTHYDNTRWVSTDDGAQAVGEDIVVQGPDYTMAVILFGLGIIVVVFTTFSNWKKKK